MNPLTKDRLLRDLANLSHEIDTEYQKAENLFVRKGGDTQTMKAPVTMDQYTYRQWLRLQGAKIKAEKLREALEGVPTR